MKRFYYLLPLIGLVLVGMNCQKELSYSGTSNDYASLTEFFEKNQAVSEKFKANSSNAISFQTRRGTKIEFWPNSFVTASGQPVTGDISIEVKEILNPSEMILSRVLPMSNGQPLESGGEYLVKPTQNGQALQLAPGYFMKIKLPSLGIGMNNMQVFNGRPTSGTADSKVDWVLNTNPGNGVFIDTFSFSRTLFSDSVDWINCDRFLNEPTINYTVYPGNISGFDSLSVVVHFSGRNSVMSLQWEPLTSKFFSSSVIASPATIVGIGIKNHKLQASIIPTTLQNNQSVTLNFSPVTEDQLKQRLSELH